MANKLLLSCLRQNHPNSVRGMCSFVIQDKIGNRDIVGNGFNGTASYIDRPDFPFPAVRFKANSPQIMALREKEKGDWKKLSLEEKKSLYRATFCQTLVEVQAPTGEWKGGIGVTLLFVSLTLWSYYFLKLYVYPPLPITFSEPYRWAQFQRMVALDVNPINGISAKP